MVGQLALSGHLTVGIFPKLGYLKAIWRLLQGGPEFLDRTNAKSESSYKVWDVNWGSVFTRANGSAASVLTEFALRKHKSSMHMPENVRPQQRDAPSILPIQGPGVQSKVPQQPAFRRYQELHIIRMSRKKRARTLQATFFRFIISRHLLLVGLVVVLCVLGGFGSATIIVNGLLSKLVCRLLRTERPSGYLENNENHNACMLSAVNDNATTWYLYMGDRGAVDWLLNKTMLSTPSAGKTLKTYFHLAHVAQLLAMTFVAAQKGIDGLCLVILLFVNYGYQFLYGSHKLARQWLDVEQVSVDAHSFKFSGRTPMIGAVHLLSEARSAEWIDTLVTPCPRIEAWLDQLSCDKHNGHLIKSDLQALSPSDRSWVSLNTQLTLQAANLIRQQLKQGVAAESLSAKGN